MNKVLYRYNNTVKGINNLVYLLYSLVYIYLLYVFVLSRFFYSGSLIPNLCVYTNCVNDSLVVYYAYSIGINSNQIV